MLSIFLLVLVPLMVFLGGMLTGYSEQTPKKREPNFVERGLIKDWTKPQNVTDER